MKLSKLATMIATGVSCAYLTQCTSIPTTITPPLPSGSHAGQYPEVHSHQDNLDHFLHGEYGRPAGIRGDQKTAGTSPKPNYDDGIDNYAKERMVDRFRWMERAVGIIDPDYNSDPIYGKDTKETRERNLFGSKQEDNVRDGQLDNRTAEFIKTTPTNLTDPKLAEWIDTQDKMMTDYLVNDPIWQKVKGNLNELLDYETPVSKKKYDGVGEIEMVRDFENGMRVFLTDIYGDKRLILNEKDFAHNGLGSFGYSGAPVVNPKGTLIAYATQESGADDDMPTLYVKNIATGEIVVTMENVDTDNFAWYDDDSFVYRKWPQIFRHDIGKKRLHDPMLVDMNTLGMRVGYEENSPHFEFYDAGEDKNRYFVMGGGAGVSTFFIMDMKTGYVHQVHDQAYFDKVNKYYAVTYHRPAKLVHFDPDTLDVWFISTELSEVGDIFKTNLKRPHERRVVVRSPDSYDFLKDAIYHPEGDGYLLITYLKDVSDKVILANTEGKLIKDLTPMELGVATKLVSHVVDDKDNKRGKDDADKEEDKDEKTNFIRFDYSNTITPITRYKYSISEDKFTDARYPVPMPKFNPDDYEIKRVFYPSKDGTNIPMLIAHKKGIKLDGTNPTMLYAYGGFGIRGDMGFGYSDLAYLDNGMIYAEAFIRGGGEYGRPWHKAAEQDKRDRQFEDMAAAADYLKEHGYADSKHLALSGWSQGGFMTGAMLTLYPDKFRAAIPGAGVFDMFRFDSMDREDYFLKEYGLSWGTKQQYDALKRWSPYQNVKAGVCYPSTLVVVPTRDDRVWPAHSYKFTAALQEHQACQNPVLMYAVHGEGHNPITRMGQVDRIHRTIAFALKEIGVTDVPKNARPDFESLKTEAQKADEAKEKAENEAKWAENRAKRDGQQ